MLFALWLCAAEVHLGLYVVPKIKEYYPISRVNIVVIKLILVTLFITLLSNTNYVPLDLPITNQGCTVTHINVSASNHRI